MVYRKKLVRSNDILQFRLLQRELPEKLKMKIMLCTSSEGVCAGLICSVIGKTAIYMFGAMSNKGLKSGGSYLLQWKLVERLKQAGVAVYNLNGINPVGRPGVYKFKNDFAGKNGKDVHYLGRFDACFPGLSSWSVACGDTLRTTYSWSRKLAANVRGMLLWRKTPT
jgi:lipid II:glycine glycyltransferase (peptidoglycan interpeptide bridge formation enzyme)